jgi:hypothetical protein
MPSVTYGGLIARRTRATVNHELRRIEDEAHAEYLAAIERTGYDIRTYDEFDEDTYGPVEVQEASTAWGRARRARIEAERSKLVPVNRGYR